MKKVLLIVLDGFGEAPAGPFNAVKNSPMPFYHSLLKTYPFSWLTTHGPAVGLPEGVMGSSEVGHFTLGGGRCSEQELSRIDRSIAEGSFFTHPLLQAFLEKARQEKRPLHLLGLLSPGGVHSHQDHLFALLQACEKASLTAPVWVHAFLDGRDTPPQSAQTFLSELFRQSAFSKPGFGLGSLAGRYFAMDRDQRWERTREVFELLTGKLQKPLGTLETLKAHSDKQESDEFLKPFLLNEQSVIQPEDLILFFNFRADRARQLTHCFVEAGWGSQCLTFTPYDTLEKLPVSNILFPPTSKTNFLGEWLSKHGKTQLRLAETEKYAHVTFFFNGGVETLFPGETRVLIPSPRTIPTYDLQPEMSAPEIQKRLLQALQEEDFDFILVNFANADMVGHTGHYPPALKAAQTLDECLQAILPVAQQKGVEVLLTADHGNLEIMQDPDGRPHTQHTLSPVPCLWISERARHSPFAFQSAGTLADVMPTLCEFMQLPIPPEVTGKSLLQPLPMDESGQDQIHKSVDLLKSVLGDALLGIYLYGSSVTSGLRRFSDLDLFVVSQHPTTLEQQQQLTAGLLPLSSWPIKNKLRPLEVTLVSFSTLHPWHYPPLFDFQYGEWLRTSDEKTMPDLALLISQVLGNHRILFGPPPVHLLPTPPWEDLVRAMQDSLSAYRADLQTDTRNVFLSFARMVYLMQTKRLGSKEESARWILPFLPEPFRKVMERASAIYRGEHEEFWEDLQPTIQPCADWLVEWIEKEVGKTFRFSK